MYRDTAENGLLLIRINNRMYTYYVYVSLGCEKNCLVKTIELSSMGVVQCLTRRIVPHIR